MTPERVGLFDRARALEIMEREGPLSKRAWARACIADGVFTAEHRASAELTSAMRHLGPLLREKDDGGLPRMGQVGLVNDAGEPLLGPRALWDVAAYTLNVRLHLDLSEQNTAVATGLARECSVRYHCIPEDGRLPGLDYDDGGPDGR